MLTEKIKQVLRDVPDFPKPGIIFKDITPLLLDPALCAAVIDELVNQVKHLKIDVVAGVESRGFLFGLALAQALKVPFVPIRKAGKLPYKTIKQSYDLEYGSATLEVHEDAFIVGQNVLLHDDLLATGGTVLAASKLVELLGAKVAGYSFLINLEFLKAKKQLSNYSNNIFSLVDY